MSGLQLVALDLPGGDEFVNELGRAWDAGNAVLPVDQRLPPAAKLELYDRLRPAVVITGEGEHRRPGAMPVGADDALVVATSGTTGEPKGVVLTHEAVAASAVATSQRLGVGANDHWLACLPLSHVGGLSVVTRALYTGSQLTVHPRFDPVGVAAAAERGANAVSLVPTALGRIDPDLFEVILLGGSRPPSDRPSNSVITYGMTETGSGVVYDRRPLDGVEIQITDGEIELRAPMLLRCYRGGDPFEWSPLSDDGWFPTGDLGDFDGNELEVFGRRGDLIISGGENVWPEPVEAVIRDLAGVAAVAVVGRDDSEWGQRVTALVVPSGAPPSLDQIRAAVKEQLPAFCAPRELELVERLPTTSLGKLQRHRLRS